MVGHLSKTRIADSAGGGHFSAWRVASQAFGEFGSPIVGIDHYRMSDVTFAPHPHAGFSAVSYIFEDSISAMRNRDTLGNDFLIHPGGLTWSQAGSGMMHDEFPETIGKVVHGLQIFVNLSAKNKFLDPEVIKVEPEDIPVWKSSDGAEVRVVVGTFAGLESPAKPAEPHRLLDVALPMYAQLEVPLQDGWNMLAYGVSGKANISIGDRTEVLGSNHTIATAARDANEVVLIRAQSDCRIALFAGETNVEPIVQHGPFAMNNQAQISDAIDRFQKGQMGRLLPL